MTQPSPRRSARLQETGLLLVIFALGLLLTLGGGSVRTPLFTTDASGQRQRVFTTNADGQTEPAFTTKNKFLNAQNLALLAKDTSFTAIMALGATFVIITGGIDLSVAAIYALASVLGALTLHYYGPQGLDHPTSALLFGLAATLVTATVAGLLNGAMITALKVHPFIITLGTMTIYRGIAFVLTNGQSIGDFPANFRSLILWQPAQGLTLVPTIVMLLATAAAAVYLGRLTVGRRLYAIGGNPQAAHYSGLNVPRIKLSVYIISGLTAGIAAILSLGYYGGATSGDGQGYELNVIAAAVVGGASLSGGKGTALGALLGALTIQLINTGIVILGINQNYSQIIIGAVVILAVLLDQLNTHLSERRSVK